MRARRRKPYAAGTWGPSAGDRPDRARRPHLARGPRPEAKSEVTVDERDARHRIGDVTERIAERSADAQAPLSRPDPREAARRGPQRAQLSCGNLAHGFAACGAADKADLKGDDQGQHRHRLVLQRHALGAPAARALPGADQAGGARGRRRSPSSRAACRRCAMASPRARPGMELSLFSRDVIALATAVALSHDMFDGALYPGRLRQDRAGPGDRRPELRPSAGDLRARRADDLRPVQRREVAHPPALSPRARSAATSCSRPRAPSYHGPGTCTFYGTANSNQMLMEIMGLHLPGAPSSTRTRRCATR